MEDGPEFVKDGCGVAELRLVVSPIKDVFGIPKRYNRITFSNRIKKLYSSE